MYDHTLFTYCLIDPLNIPLFEYSLNTQKMKAFTFIVPYIYIYIYIYIKMRSLSYSRMSGLGDLKFNLDLILFRIKMDVDIVKFK